MTSNLITHIRNYITLNESALEVLTRHFRPVTYKKRAFLLQEGQVCHSLYFVEKGCLRMYFLNDKTTEQITQFAVENWWITDYFSFLDKKPSAYFLQAVEKSEIMSIDAASFESLLQEIPEMERYFRMIMQRALAASQLRIKYMYELSKEEFYLHFCSSFPEFVQRVPQYMIASYLGLTPEYVSELRKRKS